MCVEKCFSSFSSSRIVCICYAMPGFPLYFFSRVVQLAFTIFLRDTYTKLPSILWNVPANIKSASYTNAIYTFLYFTRTKYNEIHG